MSDRLSADQFEPAVGTVFAVSDSAGNRVDLTLTSVDTRDQQVPDAPEGWVPFTLRFVGPRDPFAPQGTYAVEHDAIGRADVFLVPLGQDGETTRYEAVFG